MTEQDRQKYLGIIIEETNRLSHLIRELFELAKMDENSFIIEKECLQLNEFLENIRGKLSPAFQEKQLHFNVHCEEGLTLMADAARLEQILMNLLKNALSYCSSGDVISVIAKRQDDLVSILVKDTGKGIPKKDLPHIFERFYRVEKSRSRALGGVGLGLSIVKELVQAHGGEITAQSKENKGTSFILTFKGVKKHENNTTH